MKVLIDIDEEEYKTLSSLSDREKVNDLMGYEKIIANGTALNGTNGDVLKAVYPNEVVEMDSKYYKNHNQVITIDGSCYFIDSDWWNAPYKGVE